MGGCYKLLLGKSSLATLLICDVENSKLIALKWIDRVSGICGFYGSQIMGMGEQQISRGFFRKFEQALYATYGRKL